MLGSVGAERRRSGCEWSPPDAFRTGLPSGLVRRHLGRRRTAPPLPDPASECRRPEDAPSVLTRSGIPPQGPSPPLWLQLPVGFKLLTLLLYSVSCPSGQTLISYCELDLATRIVIKAMVAVFEVWFILSFPFVHILCCCSSLSRVRFFGTPWTACNTPGFPVLHCLLELTQTHVQPSHPQSSPSPALSFSQH